MVVWDVFCFCFCFWVSSFLKHAVSSYFVSSGVAGHCRFATPIRGLPTEGKGLKRSAVGFLCWL
jgi:hypothetical protein